MPLMACAYGASLLLLSNHCSLCFRVKSLPLVCQRWHRMLADAGMWPTLDVAPLSILLHDDFDVVRGLHAWLRQRLGHCCELTLRVSGRRCCCRRACLGRCAAMVHAHSATHALTSRQLAM